jgi:hypothetical protein
MKKPALVLSTMALAGALALTGCTSTGGATNSGAAASQQAQVPKDGPTYAAIASDVKSNITKLTSVSMKGNVDTDGTKMDLEASGALTDTGDFTLHRKGAVKGQDADATIVRAAKKTYIKASEQFFKANMGDSTGAMAKALGDKYLLLPDSVASSMGSMSMKGLLDNFTQELPTADAMKDPKAAGKLTDFQGQQVYEYDAKDGTKLFVSSDGSKHLVGVSGDKAGTVVFSDFNKAATVTPPAAGDVLDLSALQSKVG